jgi:Flp pilus assembly protein TadG
MAEFALVLTPLMAVLLGILQMGLVLNAYVTLTNASREGARAATIYVYDRTAATPTKATNDANREQAARNAVMSSMGMLSTSPPQFSTSDIVVTYSLPAGVTETDTRAGQYVTVALTYHLDLFIPLIGDLLPKDAGGRMPLGARVTMVIN